MEKRELLLWLRSDTALRPLDMAALAADLIESQAAELEALRQQAAEGWKEAAIGWAVCGSIHAEYAKGKDPLFKTRAGDFERHANDAREAHSKIDNAMQGSKG